MVGREGFEPSTIGLKGQQERFYALYFNRYRGARRNLCPTMHNDAQLIPAKSPQFMTTVIL
jgi:hypothetical protein